MAEEGVLAGIEKLLPLVFEGGGVLGAIPVEADREADELDQADPVRNGFDRNLQMTPRRLPTFSIFPRARSMWAKVWVAIRLHRMRASPSGTAGAITGLTKTPSSWSRIVAWNVLTVSPMRTGRIGVSERPVWKPSSLRPFRNLRVLSQRLASRSGSRCMIRTAASAAAAFGGEMAALNIIDRAVCLT